MIGSWFAFNDAYKTWIQTKYDKIELMIYHLCQLNAASDMQPCIRLFDRFSIRFNEIKYSLL